MYSPPGKSLVVAIWMPVYLCTYNIHPVIEKDIDLLSLLVSNSLLCPDFWWVIGFWSGYVLGFKLACQKGHSAFRLHDVLFVPATHYNFISAFKFCEANNASIEFLPSSFLISQGSADGGDRGWFLSRVVPKMVSMSGRPSGLSTWNVF